MIRVVLNSYDIPIEHVKKLPRTDEKISLNNTTLIASKMDIILDNTDPSLYDDRYVGAFFYAADWYNAPAEVYEDEQLIWKGRMKNLSVNEKDNTLTVETANVIRDMANTPCVINSTGNVTPAELAYTILTDPSYMALTDDDLVMGGYNLAIAIQDAASVYARCVYTIEDNQNVLPVIGELCRITQMHLFSLNNRIYLYQWQKWDGILGTRIFDYNVIPGTYSHKYIDIIFNTYNVLYKNGDAVAASTGSDATSIFKHGKRLFSVPSDKVESTTATSFKILLLSVTAAAWCGALALERYKYMKKQFQLTVGDELNYLLIGDQLDLAIVPYQNEPTRLIERSYNREKKEIQITGEFLNLPYEYLSRDTTPPDPVELIAAIGWNNKIYLKWTASLEDDHVGYLIYFSTSPGEWRSELSLIGISPLDVKNPRLSPDGYCYMTIPGLTPGARYYFKIASYDTSFNVSAHSNILSAVPTQSADSLYCLQGSIFTGLTLDISNTLLGAVPDGYMTYADLDDSYDWDLFITASFQSGVYFSESGFSTITWNAISSSSVCIKIAESEDGTTWTWGSEIDVSASNYTTLTGKKYMKYIIIFYSPSWDDTDSIYITSIEEAA